MNKKLLTLAGLLSVLAANQAFGWILNIKNDTKNTYPYVLLHTSCGSKTRKWIPGELDSVDMGECNLNWIQVGTRPPIAYFWLTKDTSGRAINPQKGLTIIERYGKTVIVDNLFDDMGYKSIEEVLEKMKK